MGAAKTTTRSLTGTLPRGLLVLVLAAAVVTGVPMPAQAHRDGCHRWHSCPSDSGSYVCGDLGYFSECPGGEPGGTDDSSSGADTSSDPEPVDTDPPAQPDLSKAASSSGGRVRVTVRAESGARLKVLDEDGKAVATATATGGAQQVSFKAADGRRTYTVLATDAAGNESDASEEVAVDVDATAPTAESFAVGSADPDSGISKVTLRAEAGARYEFTLKDRKEHFSGTLGDDGLPRSPLSLRLPNGSYIAKLVLRDAIGNAATTTQAFRISLARVTASVARTSALNESPVVFAVTGPAGSKGALTVPGQQPVSFLMGENGRTEVSLPIPEGRIAATTATLTDPFGRRGTAVADAFTLDTTAPSLTVRADERRALYGDVDLTVTAEPGAHVTVTGRRDKSPALNDSYVASHSVWTSHRQLPPGDYTVTVVARDAVGNTARRSLTVKVSDRMTTSDVITTVVTLLVILALLLLAGWLIRRKWRTSVAQRQAREAARLAAESAERDRRARRDHESQVRAYERADQEWCEREAVLVDLYEVAQHYRGREIADFRWGRPRGGERVLIVADGALIEERSSQGVARLEAEDSGEIVVTSHRLIFIGAKKREWDYDKVLSTERSGNDSSVVKMTNRRRRHGVRFTEDAEQALLMLDLALADAKASRSTIEYGLRDELARHRSRRPQRPTPFPEQEPKPTAVHPDH